MSECANCDKTFEPSDDEHIRKAVKVLIPGPQPGTWNDGNIVFCGATCLFEFGQEVSRLESTQA